MIEIRRLSGQEALQHVGALGDVLIDCVQGGASVSFMSSLTKTEADGFFANVVNDVERGGRILLAAFDGDELTGTVQVILSMPPNQPHRGEIAKLLVVRRARGQGTGARLMERAEQAGRDAGKTLLVLDTATGGDAERLYTRMGWTRVGVIPGYAMYPDGAWGDTTFFWKRLD